MRIWLISTLFQTILTQIPVCGQGEYSTIHFCDGIGEDIPKD